MDVRFLAPCFFTTFNDLSIFSQSNFNFSILHDGPRRTFCIKILFLVSSATFFSAQTFYFLTISTLDIPLCLFSVYSTAMLLFFPAQQELHRKKGSFAKTVNRGCACLFSGWLLGEWPAGSSYINKWLGHILFNRSFDKRGQWMGRYRDGTLVCYGTVRHGMAWHGRVRYLGFNTGMVSYAD
jgi:hypothetical protein